MSRPPKTIGNIARQIADLEQEAQALREKVRQVYESLLVHLNKPRSFSDLEALSGIPAEYLKEHVEEMYAAGLVRRWDLPRYVRTDLSDKDKRENLKEVFCEAPLGQGSAERLTGLTTGQVSGVITELQVKQGMRRLGNQKGDPWYVARGTESNLATPATDDSENDTRYQLRRPRRGRSTSIPPKPRARGPKGGT